MNLLPRRALLCLALAASLASAASNSTALDRYVAAPDPNYKYELVSTIPGEGHTTYVLDMTSQAWLTPAEVDRTIWKHWVTIIKPAAVKHDTGLLFITGGDNKSKPPAQADANLRTIAMETASIVVELRMVPNQPLTFAGDATARKEDSLIAYGWDKYLRGGDEKWLARLPMTKSAVRAMDSVTSFCASQQGGGIKVDKFVVAGGSKRGWTTWTTAAVDKRVVAIVPFVIDLLNMVPSFEHHWRVYGFWAPAIKDYDETGIMDRSRTPRYKEMLKVVEPYSYRERLTMPKLIVNATGDQFFLPDSWKFYFDDLHGEKHLRYVPNADHSLRRTDAYTTLAAFYDAVLNDRARPEFSWKAGKNGTLTVKTKTKPEVVKLWQATNPTARDFRLEKIGAAWKETVLQPGKNGTYQAKVNAPSEGWTAYLVELTFPSGGKHPLKFTTGVYVTPDKYPYPPFEPKTQSE